MIAKESRDDEFDGWLAIAAIRERGRRENEKAAAVPRIAIDEFGDGEAVEVYIAGRLAEAQLIEELFNGCDVEYAVEVQSYLGGTVFEISEYAGAAFYVSVEQAEFCRRILREAGFEAGMID